MRLKYEPASEPLHISGRMAALGHPAAVRDQREFFIDNLLVRIHFIIVVIRRTGLAPWEFEFPFPGSLTSTFLAGAEEVLRVPGILQQHLAPGRTLLLLYSRYRS